MGYAQLEELKKHGMYLSTPKGISMNPMLYEADSVAEIHTITRPPVRYDVVMYIRGESQGVIHRVLYKKGDVYVINGDNCWQKEYVRQEQIYGIVTRFYRRGRWHEVTEPAYRLYSHIWADLFFIRRPILYIRDKLKSLKRKMQRKLSP
ncbi:MAG: S24/S26 family peptidase [Acutalibacteraceae bacterium]